MRKNANYCYLLFLILLSIKGHRGFFIKHSSGLCLQSAFQYWVKGKDTGPLDGQWGPLYHVYFQNTCLHRNAQFRFFEPFSVLHNIGKNGTFLANTEYSEQFYIYHSPHAKSASTYIYSAQFALKQTSTGALKLNNGYCPTPVKTGTNPKRPSIPINGSAVYHTNRCDQEEQKFVFGSVTCEGNVTTDVNCHRDQVMVIQNAIYGGRRDMKTCGYNKNEDCLVSVTYLAKSLCDGKQKCAGITVNNKLFSVDPCHEILKYLYFEYICTEKELVKQLSEPLQKPFNVSSNTLSFMLEIPSGNFRYFQVIVLKLSDGKTPTSSPDNYKESDLLGYAEAKNSPQPKPYIAAIFQMLDNLKKEFKLGDGKIFSLKTRRHGRSIPVVYYNGPLEPGTSYSVFQRVYKDKHDYFSTGWSPATRTNPSQTTSDECCNSCGETSKTAFYVVIAILVIIIAVLIVVIVYLTVCRRSTHTPTTEDNVVTNVVNESLAGDSYVVPLSSIGQNREDNNRDSSQYDELQIPRNDQDEHYYQSLQ